MNKLILFVAALSLAFGANAGKTWTDKLEDWSIYIDNGVVYIHSGSMPAGCSHDRAQIDTSSTIKSETNQRDIYSFALMSYASGKDLYIVTDESESPCFVYGVKNKKY